LSRIVQLAPIDDTLAPQYRLITQPAGAEEKPSTELEVFENQRRRPAG
jgi:hypothetical protein